MLGGWDWFEMDIPRARTKGLVSYNCCPQSENQEKTPWCSAMAHLGMVGCGLVRKVEAN